MSADHLHIEHAQKLAVLADRADRVDAEQERTRKRLHELQTGVEAVRLLLYRIDEIAGDMKALPGQFKEVATATAREVVNFALEQRNREAEQRSRLMEERVKALEFAEAGRRTLSSWQRWFVGTVVVGGFIGGLGALATLLWLAVGS